MIHWLGLSALIPGSLGLISDQETKNVHVTWCGQKKEKICIPLPHRTTAGLVKL